MKNLVIGDPHIRVQDIPEGWRLIERIKSVAADEGVTQITFMGDLFHNHSIMHVEVMHFWRQVLSGLAQRWPVYIILGNHDGPQEMRPGVHALAALEMQGVTVIDRPYQMMENVWAVPFMRMNDDFVTVCTRGQLVDVPTLYCHQEFNGCKYDNGYYSKEGVDPAAIPQKTVISGHIHAGQEFGKVWYVGAPRWMIASDANQDRFLWVIQHDASGAVISRKPFPTDPACTRMVQVQDTVEKPVTAEELPVGCKAMVDIHGPASWIEERKSYWHGRARVRTFATDERQLAVRESDGIGVAFRKYLEAYEPKFGVPKPYLEGLVHQRLGV